MPVFEMKPLSGWFVAGRSAQPGVSGFVPVAWCQSAKVAVLICDCLNFAVDIEIGYTAEFAQDLEPPPEADDLTDPEEHRAPSPDPVTDEQFDSHGDLKPQQPAAPAPEVKQAVKPQQAVAKPIGKPAGKGK